MPMPKQLNLYSDKSSLVLTALLRDPGRKWVVRDFLSEGISLGQANKTLNRAEEFGYVLRVRHGRNSFLKLKSRKQLLSDWSRFYGFDLNNQVILFDPGKETIRRLDQFFKKRALQYALTAFSASRLISSRAVGQSHDLYINIKKNELKDVIRQMQNQLGLLRLAEGGNVRLAVPYYRSSVFSRLRMIHGVPVVSKLQLYLDLFGLPGGADEIRSLAEFYKRRREPFV